MYKILGMLPWLQLWWIPQEMLSLTGFPHYMSSSPWGDGDEDKVNQISLNIRNKWNRLQLNIMVLKDLLERSTLLYDYSDNSRTLVTSATRRISTGPHGTLQHLDSFSDCTSRAGNCVMPLGRTQDQTGMHSDENPYGLTHASLPCRETLNVFFMSVNWCWRIPHLNKGHLLVHSHSLHIHVGVFDPNIACSPMTSPRGTLRCTYMYSKHTHYNRMYRVQFLSLVTLSYNLFL